MKPNNQIKPLSEDDIHYALFYSEPEQVMRVDRLRELFDKQQKEMYDLANKLSNNSLHNEARWIITCIGMLHKNFPPLIKKEESNANNPHR